MAVALAAGGLKGDASAVDRGWFDSTYVVEVPLATASGSCGGGGGGGGGDTFELEGLRIESLLQRSLPGARLRRLVRLQDRARMLRFVCERDAAISSAATAAVGTSGVSSSTNSGGRRASISRLFADPRDVVARDTLAAIAAPGAAAATSAAGGKAGHGWTVGPTLIPEDRDDDINMQAGGLGSTAAAAVAWDKIVRCAETAQFAAVAFAPPPTEPGGEGAGGSSNLRTLAIVRAIVGVPQERGGPNGTEARAGCGGRAAGSTISTLSRWPLSSSSSSIAASAEGPAAAAAAGGEIHDPFLGVDYQVDDLTRAGGIGLSSPPLSSADDGGGVDDDLRLQSAPGLSSPPVHSIKTLEVVGGGAQGETSMRRWYSGSSSGRDTPVYTLRHDACYPEYLATFSL